MCGIFGYLATDCARILDLDWIKGLIEHRGPDASGCYHLDPVTGAGEFGPMHGPLNTRLALGHLRLSIIDTSDAGIQPFISRDGRFVLSYNGEIYNYVELRDELKQLGHAFETGTDTEVLLKAWEHWGEECLNRFTGMFAFLLFDTRENRLFAVRDPFGIKPLYLMRGRGEVAFCSDIMGLVPFLPAEGQTLFEDNTLAYLCAGTTQFEKGTVLEAVERVELGELIELDVRSCEVVRRCRYFDFADIRPQDWSFEDAKTAIRDAVFESVELHMRADVPYAATLSGGIDSSVITCVMREISDKPIHTFSYHAQTKEISETKWIDIINRHVGAIPHPIAPAADDFCTDIDSMVMRQGEPFGGLSIYASYKVQESIAEQGFKVILSGQGADEMFAGYTYYLSAYGAGLLSRGRFVEFYRWFNRTLSRVERVRSKQLIGRMLEQMFGHRTAAMLRSAGGVAQYPAWVREEDFAFDWVSFKQKWRRKPLHGSYLRSALCHSITGGPLAELLRYEDRNAMAHSIENRVPFCTTKLARLTLSMPDHFLISPDGTTKHVLREAMRGVVPDAILDRRDKIGFEPDNSTWLDPEHLQTLVADRWTPGLDPYIDREIYLETLKTSSLSDPRLADAVWRTLNLILSSHNFADRDARV